MNGFVCAHCGAENEQNTNFCTNCGMPRQAAQQPKQPVQMPKQAATIRPQPAPSHPQPAKRGTLALISVLAASLLVFAAALVLVFVFHEEIFGSEETENELSTSISTNRDDAEPEDTDQEIPDPEEEAEVEEEMEEIDLPEMLPYPSNAVSYNGHHYYLFNSSHAATWEAAKAFCEEQGGYLAVISSQKEDRFLYNYMDGLGYDNVYFGYSDAYSEGDWYWSDEEYSSYTNWYPGEPNNYASREHYAMYYLGYKDGTWNDDNGLIFDLDHAPFPAAKSIRASSELTEGSTVYDAVKAIDGDPKTPWVEDAAGQGIGETLTMELNQSYDIVGITIRGGFQYSPDFYDVNSRPRVIELIFSDGTSEEVELADVYNVQTIYLSHPVSTTSVTIKIKSVYPGSKFEDTCISEVSLVSGILNTAFVCEWSE